MKLYLLTLASVLGACSLPADSSARDGAAGRTYDLYFLGGQSNMDGYGRTADLGEADSAALGRVQIYVGNSEADGDPAMGLGEWAPLQPGFGTGYQHDGSALLLSDRFGRELSFGQALAASNPDRSIALVKYVRGGTALIDGGSSYGDWAPDHRAGHQINQYDHALATIRAALAPRDIDGDGQADRLVPRGIVWMQGEADAYHSAEAAALYEDNLREMMALLRAALGDDDLPVLIGLITDSGRDADGLTMDWSPEVQAAQARFVERDACAALVESLRDHPHAEDGWHYESAAYLDLGRDFAEAALALETDCP